MIKKIVVCCLLMGSIIMCGCIYQNPPTQTQTSIISNPSAPQSYNEKYCLNATITDISKPQFFPGGKSYSPTIFISGTVKSNCNYPVEGSVQLWAYDKYNNLIRGLWPDGSQTYQSIVIKPNQTQNYSMEFDIRSIPQNNPRDTSLDPPTATFNVTTKVSKIVDAYSASQWA
jgi:hypothetical protein